MSANPVKLHDSSQSYERLPPSLKKRLKASDFEILVGIAEGVLYEEIGFEVGLDAVQISNRVVALRRVFAARTTAQMVAKAYHYGVLQCPDPKARKAELGQ